MMDLSKFRKVSDDGSVAVLKHAFGHELRIAKHKLSSKHREQLEKLPTSKAREKKEKDEPVRMADGGMAEGPCRNPNCHSYGKVHPNCRCYSYASGGMVGSHKDGCPFSVCARYADGTPSVGSDPTVTLNSLPPDRSALDIERVGSSDLGSPAPTDLPPLQVEPVRQMGGKGDEIPAAVEQAPVTAGPQSVMTPSPYMAPPSVKEHLNAEDQAFQQDLQNGHITPKTYESLFADKGTLGKIGTLFGLMVSGAGSGLARQPNAVMEMMKQTINNDLDAQKSSKTNAQNFLRINQQGLLNDAQIKKLQQEGKLTETQAQAMRMETKIKSYTLTNMQMNRAALHKLTNEMQKLPVGSPQRQQMEQVMRTMFDQVNSENYNLSDRAHAAASIFMPPQVPGGITGTPQGSESDIGGAAPGVPSLLHPGAEQSFQGLQYTPKAKDQLGEITRQFTSAQQVDKVLPDVLKAFDTMAKDPSWMARVNEGMNPHAVAGVGTGIGMGLGSLAGGAGAVPGGMIGGGLGEAVGQGLKWATDTDSVRAYNLQRATLRSAIANALSKTNIHGDQIEEFAKEYSPVAGDSPSTISEKRRSLVNKIMHSPDTSLLKTWHLTSE